eukprot:5339209-Pleurochrysis_carterae.AAC.1
MRASRSSRVGAEKDKGHLKGVPTVHGSSDLGIAGAFDQSPSRDTRPLEVTGDAYSGLLERVRGSPDPRAVSASRSSRVGGEDKSHLKGVPTVHGSSDLGMAGAFDESPSRDARPLE